MWAQQILDAAEVIQEEAERVMAQARNTFAKAMALNPEALRSMADTIRTLEEAISTERHLRRLTRQQAEEESEWAKQRATDAILSALSSVRKASNYVNRELEESARIASTAGSLSEASQDDLKRAQAMLSEAESSVRQEARRLLDQPWAEQAAPSRETTAPYQPRTQRPSQPPPVREPTPEPKLEPPRSIDVERTAPIVSDEVPPQPEVYPVQTSRPRIRETVRPGPDISGSLEQPSVPQDRQEIASTFDLERALDEFLNSVEESDAAPTLEEVRASAPTPSEGLFLDNLDFTAKEPVGFQQQRVVGGEASPIQNMENVQRPPEHSLEPPAVEAEGEFGDDLLAHLQESLTSMHVPEEPSRPSPNDVMEELLGSGPPAHSQTPPSDPEWSLPGEPSPDHSGLPQSTPTAETYSGILYIVFTPATDAATLSFFWDVVDTVAGVGKVTAQTPLADGSGHEFTLDLGNDVLALEELKRRTPGAEVAALGQDRLRIELAPMTD